MATKKISDFTPSSAPGLHWLIPFGETDLTNFAVRYDDFQKYFGQDGAVVSVGDYTPDSSVIFNVYSSDRGFVADVNYFSISGLNTGKIYAGSRINLDSANIYLNASVFSVSGASTSFTGNSFAANYASNYALTAGSLSLYSTATTEITANTLNVTAPNETHGVNGNFILQSSSTNFFSSALTGSHFLPTLGFSVRTSDPAGKINLYSNQIELSGIQSFESRVGEHKVFIDEDGVLIYSPNQSRLQGTSNVEITSNNLTATIGTGVFNVGAMESHTAKAFRFIGNTGWGANIPFYFEANNNAYSDAFYFYSESGKFRTVSNDLSLKAYSNVEISGQIFQFQGGSFNITNDQSLFSIAGYGSNLKSSITIDSDGLNEIQNDTLNLYQNSLYSYSANSTRIVSNNSILLTGASINVVGNNSVSLLTTASFAIPGVQPSGPNNILMEQDGTNTIVSDTLIMRQNSTNYISAGSDTFQANSFLITATGSYLSLADRTGYIIRSTGDSFIDSDKAAATFATNGADTAHYSNDTTLWMNKTTGFFIASGARNFTTLLRTGDFYMDSLKFAFVGPSGMSTNFAIDLSIREFSGASSKVIGNTGALRMNASDFTKHTSMDGCDYLETELDVGVILKGSVYSYDIFTTIVTGNSTLMTGRLGINGQFIKKGYSDFLTGGA